MKVALRYFSKFGHTKKMVDAVGDILKVIPKPISVPLTEPVDVLYLGCGVMLGRINWRMRNFIKTLTPAKVKKVICFGSSAISDSPVPMLRELLTKQGIKVSDMEFACKGAMEPLHAGHPDTNDIQNFRKFIEQTQQALS
ncbi:MAG: hypothetical protein HDR88_10875 [Bacteroides sp.]|nr:hypothetical protein [Bacteroides sp.]